MSAEGNRPCPQCGSAEVTRIPAYSTPEWHVVSCNTCGFVFLHNPPAYEQLAAEFAWEKTWEEEHERRAAERPLITAIDYGTRWRLHMFSRSRSDLYRQIFKPGRVLDVGCSEGTSVPEPFIPYGIEISDALYRKAAENMAARGGEAIHAPAVEGIARFPDRFFSGVVMSSVVEHEVNPKTLLRHVARVLAQDGAAYIRVPNLDTLNRAILGRKWSGFRYPDHVNYFTPRSLRRMVEDCKLRLKLLHPLRLPFDDNINAVLTTA
jgi:SAM-dependent methyltransferase